MQLTAHATAEEEIFYPAAREAGIEADLLDEAEVEHASAKDLIAQIRAMTPTRTSTTPRSRSWASTSTTMSRRKRKRCSPSAASSEMDLAGLARQVAERKAELLAEEEVGA